MFSKDNLILLKNLSVGFFVYFALYALILA